MSKSSKSLVLYIMEGTFGSDDDNALLKRVADSMSVGGKQSKDRFIFIVNKMDDRKKEDGDTEQALTRIRSYLKNHGISNPNLYPAAALPALNIRRIQNEEEDDEDTIDETAVKVKKLNRNASLHLETFASLPASIKGDINKELSEAEEQDEKERQALIHTGIVSIESAIRQYVQKYAKTAKIKNIVDTFIHKLDAVGCFEETKRELACRQDESQQIVQQIDVIKHKVGDVKEAQKFQDAVDDAIVRVTDEAKETVDSIIERFQKEIRIKIASYRSEDMSLDDAENERRELEKFARKLEPDFQSELAELIRANLIDSSEVLLKNYRAKLETLTEELEGNTISGIVIEPLKIMNGNISGLNNFSMSHLVKNKKVEDGEEWIENTDKKWYKPWTWFQEAGYYRTKYKNVKYVNSKELAAEFLQPVQDVIYEDGERAIKFTLKQSKKISEVFVKEFEKLDDILQKKLSELKSYATDQELAEERIKESEEKLKWLEQIKGEVESILEI